MTVTVCINEAGIIWIENVQGDILTECFFKTDEETEDELRRILPQGQALILRTLATYFWRCEGGVARGITCG